MRIPLSWLRDHVDIPETVTAQEIADLLTKVGFEEEEVIEFGEGLVGPVVVGRVLEFVEEPQANGKTIRWCQVEVAPGVVNGIVCGARNFFVGDKVVVSLPGAVLPGGFAIAARKTYGHVSDGMICSARELQFSDDHDGIIRLAELGLDPELGTDAIELLGLRDCVIDASVLPDRGYAMSMRGIARELHIATGWAWRDPADISAPVAASPAAINGHIVDESAAQRLVLRTLEGFNPTAASPIQMQRRLFLAGMRSISLAVDVTNYVMIELGQPLHAFDADKLQGDIKVRRAGESVTLTTLDDVERALDARDIVIADDSGAIALAGTMGGASTEISDSTRRIVIEAACFSFGDIARTSRAHKLSSEASRRFERGIDINLAHVASARAASLLSELGGATEIGAIDIDQRQPLVTITMPADFPARYVGADYTNDEVLEALINVGCIVEGSETLNVTVPSWRTDISHPADLAEEVARLCGYDRIPSVLPRASAGLGLTPEQRLRRAISRNIASAGLVEVLSYPFMGAADFDALGLDAEDPRRVTLKLANPISLEQPSMRTTILGPLLGTFKRNLGRGHVNVAIFEIGMVVLSDGSSPAAAQLSTEHRPSDTELAELNAAVPVQPTYVGGLLAGAVELGAPVLSEADTWDWQRTLALVAGAAAEAGVAVTFVPAEQAPWHPGRCAAVAVGDSVVGFAGELHPRVIENNGLPARSCAFEFDLTAIAALAHGPVVATPVRTFPRASIDLAFVLAEETSADDVKAEIVSAAGDLLESVALFDVYQGAQVEAGQKSLAYALEFRAADRTLTDAEIFEVRDRVIAACANKFGARLR